ncbi:MAG: hypothetical protein ACRDY7_02480 [Acidimicrobiia bacterium]
MNAAAKLGAYGLVLAVALGGGAAVGSAVGPLDVADGDRTRHDIHSDGAVPAGGEAREDTREDTAMPGGVLVSQGGYTLEVDDTVLDGAALARFRFRITGPDGSVVEDFDPRSERELHLIVVGRDLATFAHLHPTRAADGTWTAELPALEPGAYRAFADFAPAGGPELTLGVDLSAPGPFEPAPLPEATTTATVDGYGVTLSGTPAAGTASEVAFTVTRVVLTGIDEDKGPAVASRPLGDRSRAGSRQGEPIADLEPHLGSFGHLVAIRAGDLAYLHVHPLDEDGDRGGPTVRFGVEVPSPGDYRFFFDFAHAGKVRTAAFTVHVPAGGAATAGGAGTHDHGAPTSEEDE